MLVRKTIIRTELGRAQRQLRVHAGDVVVRGDGSAPLNAGSGGWRRLRVRDLVRGVSSRSTSAASASRAACRPGSSCRPASPGRAGAPGDRRSRRGGAGEIGLPSGTEIDALPPSSPAARTGRPRSSCWPMRSGAETQPGLASPALRARRRGAAARSASRRRVVGAVPEVERRGSGEVHVAGEHHDPAIGARAGGSAVSRCSSSAAPALDVVVLVAGDRWPVRASAFALRPDVGLEVEDSRGERLDQRVEEPREEDRRPPRRRRAARARRSAARRELRVEAAAEQLRRAGRPLYVRRVRVSSTRTMCVGPGTS